MFSHISNYVPQVLHLFPRVFPLAPHFYPTSSHRNLYFEELPKFFLEGGGGRGVNQNGSLHHPKKGFGRHPIKLIEVTIGTLNT